MCGFTAYAGSPGSGRVDLVRRMAERLAHRGPDGSGLHRLGEAVLAHRRLAIIDVAGGDQPLINEDGTLALACNGEIYNHEALRANLAGRHRFATRSDSEVILHLYEEHGRDLVHLLKGMFAFVLTDGEGLFAARDALGIKPLYMGHDSEGGLWFASELKALTGVCHDVREFPAGHVLDARGELVRWYQPGWATAPVKPPRAYDGRQVAEGLEQAVERRLMSDVPLGVFLSGGLDSSLIAALVRPHVDELHSFSVGLEGSPDLEAARVMARHLGTQHHEHVYRPADVVDALETVIAHLESFDPALVRSAIPCYFVSRLAARHVKVVLSGEGSDEAFAGYLYFNRARDGGALHDESVRLLFGLHNMNLQRVDRMTMAHGLEGRVPFLDTDFLDLVMALDPAQKLHSADRPEKFLLRSAFDGLLPDSILWRTKAEFAQGCGSEWTVRDYCAEHVSDAELEGAAQRFPEDPPTTKEEFYYRRVFDGLFPGPVARRTVGRWRGAFHAARQEVPSHV